MSWYHIPREHMIHHKDVTFPAFSLTQYWDLTRIIEKQISDHPTYRFGQGMINVLPNEIRLELHEQFPRLTSQIWEERDVETARQLVYDHLVYMALDGRNFNDQDQHNRSRSAD